MNRSTTTTTREPPAAGKRAPRPLRVVDADDASEREAAAIAERALAGPATAAVARVVAAPGRPTAGAAHAPASVAPVLASPGEPLAPALRSDMQGLFGRDFTQVRVHADARAAASARELRARAYTVGSHIAFGAGRYAPATAAGRRLLAHELAHVVQQRQAAPTPEPRTGGSGAGAPAHAAAGSTGPNARADRSPGDTMTLTVPAAAPADPVLQRDADDGVAAAEAVPTDLAPASDAGTDAGSAPSAAPAVDSVPADAVPAQQAPPVTPPALAVPTLTLGPSASLTRGDTLTATVGFTPNAGETMRVSAWRYTAGADTVTRAATEPTFQTSWAGAMALSGRLAVDYAVTPAGGSAGPTATLTQAVTVADRSGAPWAASPTLNAEVPFGGRPNPPVVFSDLGRHNVTITSPVATATAVSAGPNTGFRFVGSLTAGTYTSQPRIHPALTNATSAFFRFHQNPSRLYFVVGAARTLIPLAEYSNLAITGTTLTFDVPAWEAFYKAKRFYDVTATGNDGTGPVPVRDTWWGLATNSATSGLSVLDAAAIRAALGTTGGFSLSATPRGGWSGFRLMQIGAIHTGTQSHEYVHGTHSHRANFTAMLRALDPQRKIERKVGTPSASVTFATEIATWVSEILKPNHELVDEAASRTAEAFTAVAGATMAGVNTDPASGAFLGTVWNITGDDQMTN